MRISPSGVAALRKYAGPPSDSPVWEIHLTTQSIRPPFFGNVIGVRSDGGDTSGAPASPSSESARPTGTRDCVDAESYAADAEYPRGAAPCQCRLPAIADGVSFQENPGPTTSPDEVIAVTFAMFTARALPFLNVARAVTADERRRDPRECRDRSNRGRWQRHRRASVGRARADSR